MTRVEFWPDYGSGPVWTEDGAPIDPRSLGLTDDLAEQLELWSAQYDEDRIPVEGSGDREWLDRGAHLLERTRRALGPSCEVIVTEPWWDDPPHVRRLGPRPEVGARGPELRARGPETRLSGRARADRLPG
mgnify:FL=1